VSIVSLREECGVLKDDLRRSMFSGVGAKI